MYSPTDQAPKLPQHDTRAGETRNLPGRRFAGVPPRGERDVSYVLTSTVQGMLPHQNRDPGCSPYAAREIRLESPYQNHQRQEVKP